MPGGEGQRGQSMREGLLTPLSGLPGVGRAPLGPHSRCMAGVGEAGGTPKGHVWYGHRQGRPFSQV